MRVLLTHSEKNNFVGKRKPLSRYCAIFVIEETVGIALPSISVEA